MRQALNTATELRRYTSGVAERAACHAPDVDATWPVLLGYAIVYSDSPTAMMARVNRAGTGFSNQAWTVIKGRRIGFSYRRKPTKRIDVLDGQVILASFENGTKDVEYKRFFDSL